MFMIKNENLLHFHEYFDDKMISMKNFSSGFGKVQSTQLSCGFFAQMWKDLEEKRSCANILRHLESCHVASKCLHVVHSRSPRSKNVKGIAQMDHVRLCSSKTAEENKENIIKLNVSPNRQNIK